MGSPVYHTYNPDYFKKENLIKDNDFLKDASAFLAERANYDFDYETQQEEIYNQFMEHFRRQNVTIKPEAGDLLLFPSCYTHPHQALPVKSGIKYSIVTWCR